MADHEFKVWRTKNDIMLEDVGGLVVSASNEYALALADRIIAELRPKVRQPRVKIDEAAILAAHKAGVSAAEMFRRGMGARASIYGILRRHGLTNPNEAQIRSMSIARAAHAASAAKRAAAKEAAE